MNQCHVKLLEAKVSKPDQHQKLVQKLLKLIINCYSNYHRRPTNN